MKHKRLSLEEREEIRLHLSQKTSYREIGRKLNRSHSTILREVKRFGKESYKACEAHKKAQRRNLLSGRKRILETRPEIFKEIFERLFRHWSPKQISQQLKQEYPNEPWMWISHETIYRYIYAFPRGELKKVIIHFLRQKKRLRGGRGKVHLKKQVIEGGLSIHERPKEVHDRAVPGHWEGDLIVGKNCKSAIGTLVERTSRMVFLVHLRAKNSKTVTEAFSEIFEEVSEEMKKSLTYDRGTEMAEHKAFTDKTGIPVYFADPYSPWQRGSCENTNMLIRDFFPRGTDFSKVSIEELKRVQDLLNERPRQTLGWKTPREVFNSLIGATEY